MWIMPLVYFKEIRELNEKINKFFLCFQVIYVGSYVWPCQDELVIKADIEDVPFFNAPIYLENKEQIGKIDEIFGNPRNYYFSVKITEQANAKSFNLNEKVNSKK